MEKHGIILYVSYAMCIASIVLCVLNFKYVNDIIHIHQNINGEFDKLGTKKDLVILPMLSFVIVIVISLLIKRPHILNFPIEITEENKMLMYGRAQMLLSIVALFVTSTFLTLIMQNLNLLNLKWGIGFSITYFVVLSLIPIVVISLFRKNTTP